MDIRINRNKVIGNQGEALVRLILLEIATVNSLTDDPGLDFHCELLDSHGSTFYVQAKGSMSPTYPGNTISSLPILRRTVEENWLKQSDPVFLMMSDT